MKGISNETLEQLRSLDVSSDSDLAKEEKETTLTVDNDRDTFRLHTDIPVHIRWVLSIGEECEIRGYRCKSRQLVGITADIPKGYLKLQGSNRKAQTNGAITTINS